MFFINLYINKIIMMNLHSFKYLYHAAYAIKKLSLFGNH